MPRVDCGGPKARYCRVRQRDPPRGRGKCVTPLWAARVACSVKKGAKVVTCKFKDGWDVQSVLIPKPKGKPNKAAIRKQATRIRKKIRRQM